MIVDKYYAGINNIPSNSNFIRRLKRQQKFIDSYIDKESLKAKVVDLAIRLGVVKQGKLNYTYLIKNCSWMKDFTVTKIKKAISDYLMNKKINAKQTEILIKLHEMKLIDNAGVFYYDVSLTRALLSELLQIFKNYNNYRCKTYLLKFSNVESKAV